MTSFNILASRGVSCAVDFLQFRIMRRIYQTGINLLRFSVSEQLHPFYRLVHILTYHAVGYVYG